MGYSGLNEEQLQWALTEAAGYKVGGHAIGIAATELARMMEQEHDLSEEDRLTIQRDLMVQDGVTLAATITGLDQEHYIDIAPMSLQEFEGTRPQPQSVSAAKIAVEATFTMQGVALIEDDSHNSVPYIVRRTTAYPARAERLAAARRIVSYTILGSPGETFRSPDLKVVAGQQDNKDWPHMLELIGNWWSAKLTINGHPLIIPADNKSRYSVWVNPLLAVKPEWQADGKSPRMR